MNGSRASRNNVLAGVFVLASIAIAVLFIIAFTDLTDRLEPKARYIIRFGMLDGADGLDAGSPVKVGGQRVGQVEKWSFVRDESTAEPIAIDVTIAIDRAIRLMSDADVSLTRPLLGGQSAINIASGGLAAAAAMSDVVGPPVPIEPDRLETFALQGHLGNPAFISATDYAKIRRAIDRVESIATTLSDAAPDLVNEAKAALSEVRGGAAQVSGFFEKTGPLIDEVRANWPQWNKDVTVVLDRIAAEAKALEGIGAKVSEGVDRYSALAAEARGLIEDNRADIRTLVDRASEMVDRFYASEYAKIGPLLDDAQAAMASARRSLDEVEQLVVTKRPEIEDLVTSLTLSSQQLRLAMTEIRAAPWRLLYQPGKKELENELLYNSVRQYSNAVSELRMTAEAIKALSEQSAGGRSAIPPERAAQLAEKLNRAFDEYQEREKAFFDRWVREPR